MLSPALFSVYDLAFNLGMPAEDVMEMDYDVFQNWQRYFEIRPIGWQEDYRLYLILKTQGVKEKPENIFPSIRAVMQYRPNKTQAEALKGSSFLKFLQLAAAKNNSDWKLEDES